MAKIERLIEYQDDKQRTPKEALEYMQDEVAAGRCKWAVVVYGDEAAIGHVPASEGRDLTRAMLHWYLSQFMYDHLMG